MKYKANIVFASVFLAVIAPHLSAEEMALEKLDRVARSLHTTHIEIQEQFAEVAGLKEKLVGVLRQHKEILAAQRTELNLLRNAQYAVGSIQHTFLTEDQFQRLMGKEWVLCDGQKYPGSDWEKITGNTEIPNCQGRFLRTAGNLAAPLGKAQDDQTAVNGLAAESTTTRKGSSTVSVSGTLKPSTVKVSGTLKGRLEVLWS